ncbi:MAG: sterol desaturase family protein [Leptolyngbyaceae cyanobacterium SL_7_1]|nr:sterol desaturase family protein [Leptolyngbyaceae cyanobacterium SL_7_1]
MAVLIAFSGLLAWAIADSPGIAAFRAKPWRDWVLDSGGLVVQGILIPLLQMHGVYRLFQDWLPLPAGCLQIPAIAAFLLSFVVVDYLYYWNHRLLHWRGLWQLHQVHHTVGEMDVLGTSRNTLWTSLLIVYLWVHPLLLYLLQNPTAYVLGVSLTAGLDLWRHSCLLPNQSIQRWLSFWLILPTDHAWHHASQGRACNYGANLKLWDRFHGTYYARSKPPESLGIPTPLTLAQQLFYPFDQSSPASLRSRGTGTTELFETREDAMQ